MSEALVPVPAVDRAEVARAGAAVVALPAAIVDAVPAAVERFLEFFAATIANEQIARGVRSGGGAVFGVVRGARARLAGDRAAPRGGVHPHAPGVGADGEAASGRDPVAVRLARRPPGAACESGRGGAGTETRRDEGGRSRTGSTRGRWWGCGTRRC